jgi:hypothetical protein
VSTKKLFAAFKLLTELVRRKFGGKKIWLIGKKRSGESKQECALFAWFVGR